MPNDILFRQIQSEAIKRIPRSRVATSNLYILREVLRRGDRIRARHQKIPIVRDTVMVFADEEPFANWGHDCRYLLFDAQSGAMYRDIPARFPPALVEVPETFKPFHMPVVAQPTERRIWPLPRRLHIPFPIPVGRRYAVLFSGASNNRHVNDLEFLYRTLVDYYYFREEDIYVLNYDGTINYSGGPKPVVNWPGDSTPYQMTVSGAGTKSELESVIDDLKTKLKAEDLLLIHTNNHGGHDGTDAYLCTYSGPDYTAPDFADKLAELPVYRDLIVMMEQCHSGGFNDLVVEHSTAERTSFAAACTEHRSSIGGPDFDPFARDWIAALAGASPYGATLTPSPDVSGDNKVSSIEAFAYVDGVHHSYDSPVFSERGEHAGHSSLVQRWKFIYIELPYLMELIERRWLHRPRREYMAWARTELAPRLQALEAEFEHAHPSRGQMRKRIRETVEELLGDRVRPRRPIGRPGRTPGGVIVPPVA